MSLDRVESIRRFRVLEIMEMVLKINGTTPTNREMTGNKTTVFAEFSGHIAEVEVHIHTNGWSAGERPDIRMRAYLDDDEKMEGIITTLLKFLAEKEKSS